MHELQCAQEQVLVASRVLWLQTARGASPAMERFPMNPEETEGIEHAAEEVGLQRVAR